VVLTTVETKAFSGNMWPRLKAVYPDREAIERSSMNSWNDRNFVAAVEKTGRKKVALCGLGTKTCVALPAIQALHDGSDVYVAEDCCGDVSQLAHDSATRRVVQAGEKTCDGPVSSAGMARETGRNETLTTR
jgi:nicotinamidase-related amidase